MEKIIRYTHYAQQEYRAIYKKILRPEKWAIIRDSNHEYWHRFIESMRKSSRNSLTSRWKYYGFLKNNGISNPYFFTDDISNYNDIQIISLNDWYHNIYLTR